MHSNDIQILKESSQVAPYLDRIVALADTNKKSLGFLTKDTFREQSDRGRLWIAVSRNSGEFMGYLLFGGRYPALKIFQVYVQKPHRKLGVGQKLITALTTWGEKTNYLTVSARVAADLPANWFWERAGFSLVRQESGGKSAGRMINIRVRALDTPSLLDMMACNSVVPKVGIQHIRLDPRPIIGIQTYVLDLNIFFDIVKRRIHKAEATRLISAGLNQEAKVFVTPEFVKELERNSELNKPDPVLEFARALPVLPQIPQAKIDTLLPEIEPLIFPNGVSHGRKSVQSLSDLTHIAYCIHHRVTGFITREKAMLAASEQLQKTYSLEVLSPSDLIQTTTLPSRMRVPLLAHLGSQSVSIGPAAEGERGEAERFLVSRGVTQEDLTAIWHPGSISSPRRRVTARIGGDLIAVASWDGPNSLSRPTVLHLYVEETSPWAETVIDHVLESVLRDTPPSSMRVIVLDAAIEQSKTITTAVKRGFLKSFSGGPRSPSELLNKLTYSGLITADNWSTFCREVEKVTGLRLPVRMPTLEEFNHTGIVIKNQSDLSIFNLRLFDFETLVSPGVVLCTGRAALVTPIQMKFAKGLFVYVQAQGELFPAPEALLRVEKAYFRSTRKASLFNPGSLILFYLSGSGGGTKEVIGCARITYSKILSINELELKLERQGVLSRCELEGIANREGKLHAFTFDNFNLFSMRIPFEFLKRGAMISSANLVTVEQLSSKHCAQILEYGFGLRSRTHE